MAFTGYVFHSRQEIESFVEPQHGCTFHWSRRIALQFNAFVAVGYPENENGTFYNSLCIVVRDFSAFDSCISENSQTSDSFWR
mmetsp:Transcript_9574/g.17247  ORF Transcript_9574/g.17247 Transcript_9574/m.17247 type:complete len:83 (+) Transcript_9574:254-502(+)